MPPSYGLPAGPCDEDDQAENIGLEHSGGRRRCGASAREMKDHASCKNFDSSTSKATFQCIRLLSSTSSVMRGRGFCVKRSNCLLTALRQTDKVVYKFEFASKNQRGADASRKTSFYSTAQIVSTQFHRAKHRARPTRPAPHPRRPAYRRPPMG